MWFRYGMFLYLHYNTMKINYKLTFIKRKKLIPDYSETLHTSVTIKQVPVKVFQNTIQFYSDDNFCNILKGNSIL